MRKFKKGSSLPLKFSPTKLKRSAKVLQFAFFIIFHFQKLIHLNSPTFGEEYGYPVYTAKTLCWGDFAKVQTKKKPIVLKIISDFANCQGLVQGIPASSSWLSLRKAVLESQVHARGEGTWESWLSPQRAGGELYKKVVKNDFTEWIWVLNADLLCKVLGLHHKHPCSLVLHHTDTGSG